jgi:hypothetical protein
MDESTHVEYRRVSVLAIFALLLGITSSGALIGKVLLALLNRYVLQRKNNVSGSIRNWCLLGQTPLP